MKSVMKRIFVLALALPFVLLFTCASGGSRVYVQSGNTDSGSVRVVVYRVNDDSRTSGAITVNMDGNPAASIDAGMFFVLRVSPGSHTFCAASPLCETIPQLAREIVPGEILFVRISGNEELQVDSFPAGVALKEIMVAKPVRRSDAAALRDIASNNT